MAVNKITDRFKGIIGIESSYWDGERLVIYYHNSVGLDVIKVRVADAIGKANLQGAFEITLIGLAG